MRPAHLPPALPAPVAMREPVPIANPPVARVPVAAPPIARAPATSDPARSETASAELPRTSSNHAVRPARTAHKAETAVSVAPARAPSATPPQAPSPGAARPPTERTFTLGPTPQNVDVYLDGEKKFAYDTDHKTISVPWSGNHTIELRSPAGCCFSERIDVGPDRPLPPDNIIARKLKWKPARLYIALDPPAPGARVVVKDLSARGPGAPARAGEDVSIPFQPTDEHSKEVEVDVDTGESFTSERFTVRAGEQSSHTIKLKTSN
jgi:hypothetical protein